MLIFSARVSKLMFLLQSYILGVDCARVQMQQSLTDATPMVLQVIGSSLEFSQQIPTGLKCLQAWMGLIRSRLACLPFQP